MFLFFVSTLVRYCIQRRLEYGDIFYLAFIVEYNDCGSSLPSIELIVGSVESPLACSIRSPARSFGRESPVSVRYDRLALDAAVCAFAQDFAFPAPVSGSSLS